MVDTIALFIAQFVFGIIDYLNDGTNSINVIIIMTALAFTLCVFNISVILFNCRKVKDNDIP